jgi:hypothetical protein
MKLWEFFDHVNLWKVCIRPHVLIESLKWPHLIGSVSNIVHLGELTAAKTAPFNFRLNILQ